MTDSYMRTSYHSMPRLSLSSNQKSNRLINKITPYMKQLFPYLRNFDSTHSKQLRKSNVYELATNIYQKQVKDSVMSPQRQSNRNKQQKSREKTQSLHARKRNEMEQFVEKIGNKAISNLNEKTLKVPEYTQLLMNLSQQKQLLQNQIRQFKNRIAAEQTLKYKVGIICKRHLNKIESHNENINKLKIEINRIFILANETTDQNNLLIENLRDIEIKNHQTNNSIQTENQNIRQLLQFNKNCKHAIIKQEKLLNEVRTNLTIGLKSLENSSNEMKLQEAEKAQMLLFINRKYEEKWNQKDSDI